MGGWGQCVVRFTIFYGFRGNLVWVAANSDLLLWQTVKLVFRQIVVLKVAVRKRNKIQCCSLQLLILKQGVPYIDISIYQHLICRHQILDIMKSIFPSHLDPPANGQAVIYLTGLLEVFISESFILATVSDNSVRYQAINVVKRWENKH